MKLKVNTIKFNEMLSRAIKCASNDKSFPLTSMVGITLLDNTLYLHTTDMTNHLIISQDDVEGDDFDIAVELDVLSKLIPKITSEYIELRVSNSLLKIKGNGEYVIELRLDDEGDIIRFPDVAFNDEDKNPKFSIYSTSIDTILSNNKSALSKDDPIYSKYYIGNSVISTDSIALCSYDDELFRGTKALVSNELMNLLGTIIEDEIEVCMNSDNQIIFKTDTVTILGMLSDGIEEYGIDRIEEWLNIDFEASCTLPKQAIINTLDRISLFINEFDKGGIKLCFTDNDVRISSKQSGGIETIKYIDREEPVDYECIANVNYLLSQIKSVRGDKVTIEYGNDTCLRIIDDDITKLISLMDEE